MQIRIKRLLVSFSILLALSIGADSVGNAREIWLHSLADQLREATGINGNMLRVQQLLKPVQAVLTGECLSQLFNHADENKQTSFMNAVYYGHIDTVLFFLTLAQEIMNKHELHNFLIQVYAQETLLIHIMRYHHYEAATLFCTLAHQTMPADKVLSLVNTWNKEGHTIGIQAVRMGKGKQWCTVLDSLRSTLCAEDIFTCIAAPDRLGNTALMHAVARGHEETVQNLITLSYELVPASRFITYIAHANCRGRTAFHTASTQGRASIMLELLLAVRSTGLSIADFCVQAGVNSFKDVHIEELLTFYHRTIQYEVKRWMHTALHTDTLD